MCKENNRDGAPAKWQRQRSMPTNDYLGLIPIITPSDNRVYINGIRRQAKNKYIWPIAIAITLIIVIAVI